MKRNLQSMVPSASPPEQKNRIHCLDSMRFAAAIVVVYQHCVSIHPVNGRLPVALSGFLNATSAVAFFFVLSGFVLHLSLRGRNVGFRTFVAFLVKRVFRLYPLFWVALLFGGAVLWLLPLADIPAIRASEYTATTVSGRNHHDLQQWLMQITLIAPWVDNEFVLPPMWTLAAEMRISLLFPLLSVAMGWAGRWWALLFTAGLFLICPILGELIVATLKVVPLFALGVLLTFFLQAKGGWVKTVALFVVGLALYSTAPFLGRQAMGATGHLYLGGLGSAMIILAAVQSRRLSTLLSIPRIAFLGESSYGTYILHYPFMLVAAFAFRDHEPNGWLFFGTVLTFTVATSVLSYRIVEFPMIQAGRALARKIQGGNQPESGHGKREDRG